MMGVIRID